MNFDENNLMRPFGENGILFTTEYRELIYRQTRFLDEEFMRKAIESQFYGDYFLDSPDTEEKWSHDNHRAVVCASKRHGFDYHKRMYWKDLHKMLHPRDLIFYAWATGKWYSWLAFPFLWIVTLAFMVSCLTDYKVRPGLLDRIKMKLKGEDYTKRKILKTDGKLLVWLQLSVFNMPITKRLCNWAIKNNKEFGSWEKCFKIYFDQTHPNANFPSGVYEL
jgi:hypothetical protein